MRVLVYFSGVLIKLSYSHGYKKARSDEEYIISTGSESNVQSLDDGNATSVSQQPVGYISAIDSNVLETLNAELAPFLRQTEIVENAGTFQYMQDTDPNSLAGYYETNQYTTPYPYR